MLRASKISTIMAAIHLQASLNNHQIPKKLHVIVAMTYLDRGKTILTVSVEFSF